MISERICNIFKNQYGVMVIFYLLFTSLEFFLNYVVTQYYSALGMQLFFVNFITMINAMFNIEPKAYKVMFTYDIILPNLFRGLVGYTNQYVYWKCLNMYKDHVPLGIMFNIIFNSLGFKYLAWLGLEKYTTLHLVADLTKLCICAMIWYHKMLMAQINKQKTLINDSNQTYKFSLKNYLWKQFKKGKNIGLLIGGLKFLIFVNDHYAKFILNKKCPFSAVHFFWLSSIQVFIGSFFLKKTDIKNYRLVFNTIMSGSLKTEIRYLGAKLFQRYGLYMLIGLDDFYKIISALFLRILYNDTSGFYNLLSLFPFVIHAGFIYYLQEHIY